MVEIRGSHQPHDGASYQGEDGEESEGRVIDRRVR
jgi:hypothetical protein